MKRKFQSLFLHFYIAVPFALAFLIGVLHLFGILDHFPFIQKHIPALTLILLSSFVCAFIVNFENKFMKKIDLLNGRIEDLEKKFTNKIDLYHSQVIDRISDIEKSWMDQMRLIGKRLDLTNFYIEQISHAQKKIDIIGLTGERLTENCLIALQQAIKRGCQIQILLLAPTSRLWNYRLPSDGEQNDPETLHNLKNKCGKVLKKLRQIAAIPAESRVTDLSTFGGIEIRYVDAILYNAYFLSDNEMTIGSYSSVFPGIYSLTYQVVGDTSIKEYHQMEFERLWQKGKPAFKWGFSEYETLKINKTI